jgi:hypothetical protein
MEASNGICEVGKDEKEGTCASFEVTLAIGQLQLLRVRRKSRFLKLAFLIGRPKKEFFLLSESRVSVCHRGLS